MKRGLAILVALCLAACSPHEDRQTRLRLETTQLKSILTDVCFRRFASGEPLSDVVAASRMSVVHHFNPYGIYTTYIFPGGGSRPILLDDHTCSFAVGVPGATGDELPVLDQALAQFLAHDMRGWRTVRPDNVGKEWCDTSDRLHIHSLESDPVHPGALGPLIRRTELQVRLEWDRSGWMCRYLSKPAAAYRNPYGGTASSSASSQ